MYQKEKDVLCMHVLHITPQVFLSYWTITSVRHFILFVVHYYWFYNNLLRGI